jgi:hypothetical protein
MLTDYIDIARHRSPDASGTSNWIGAKFRADQRTFRIGVAQNWWCRHPYLFIVWTAPRLPLSEHGKLVVERYKHQTLSWRIPLPAFMDMHAEDRKKFL